MRNLILGLIIVYFTAACNHRPGSLLLEAENFTDKGGWLVDDQFVEQMGSPYLLAHGLGKPVKNARTKVHFTKMGSYYLWVRTMDWAPGKWQSPGRFKLIVDGYELKQELGTQPNWNWQFAGTVNILKSDLIVELEDLTGFEGRCDAIYFSQLQQIPPNQKDELTKWRKENLNEKNVPEQTMNFDLVIAGGGIAGCAAAIAASEQGMKVALIHDRPVLGGNASSEVRVHTLGITWHYDRILNMINTEHYPNGSPEAIKEDNKRMSNIKKYTSISLFLNWRAYTANTLNDLITSVYARNINTGETLGFTAPLYLDCTGDGWIGYWSGAKYMYGREDSSKYKEGWAKYGELWSPSKSDNRVMGASLLWNSKDAGCKIVFPEVPWAMEVAKSHAALQGDWEWEFSGNEFNQIEDAEKIRDHVFKSIYGSFYNAKQKAGNENIELEWISYILGKRESRRLLGDYVYTFNDARQMVEFGDAVAMEERELDVHYQQCLTDTSAPDFLSKAQFYPVDHYYIPYRCLYSVNIKNLFMAGRCFSCSHIGLGGPRVMNTTGQMGAATGYAASLCKKHKANPRDIYYHYRDELKSLILNSNSGKPKF